MLLRFLLPLTGLFIFASSGIVDELHSINRQRYVLIARLPEKEYRNTNNEDKTSSEWRSRNAEIWSEILRVPCELSGCNYDNDSEDEATGRLPHGIQLLDLVNAGAAKTHAKKEKKCK
ncbi:uncharacterized protein PITG_23110 [Phytophthora infestans T30-4]|uniref:Secreted RxLR effector peptide protein n=1 Tax=Phytophthora infestans (strain T30-4) TaxID=403677 RepID=D0NW43_PHYIT|nr:uncharacterized protein PITG_23110 [Phytophthora infestans T30-4]EEY66885.1 conserved hypothetical protein [Phytophthora infestans T30-4]|eukprot:XP_002896694.1 conserved hypothetical protein [Phytophthora infestans T30-4]